MRARAFRTLPTWLFVAALCLTVPACGGLHKVTVQVTLVSTDGKNPSFGAQANPQTGEFTIAGLEGKGVPTGKYKVSVVALDPYPSGPDKLGGKGSGDNAPEKDISGNTEINIDIPQ
jgi:hypothetical protein